jgi:hypothetical protein
MNPDINKLVKFCVTYENFYPPLLGGGFIIILRKKLWYGEPEHQ